MPITKITNNGAQCSVTDCIEGAVQQTTVATGADTYSECACDAVMSDVVSAAAPILAGFVGFLKDPAKELKKKALEKAVKDFAAEVFKYGAGEGRLTPETVAKLSEAITVAGDHDLALEVERYFIGMQRGTAQGAFAEFLFCKGHDDGKYEALNIAETYVLEAYEYAKRDGTFDALVKVESLCYALAEAYGNDTANGGRWANMGTNVYNEAEVLKEKAGEAAKTKAVESSPAGPRTTEEAQVKVPTEVVSAPREASLSPQRSDLETAWTLYQERASYKKSGMTDKYAEATAELKEAIERDMAPHIEEALKVSFGEANWAEIEKSPAMKDALVRMKYAEVSKLVHGVFVKDARKAGSGFVKYMKLRDHGIKVLVTVKPAEVDHVMKAVRGTKVNVGTTRLADGSANDVVELYRSYLVIRSQVIAGKNDKWAQEKVKDRFEIAIARDVRDRIVEFYGLNGEHKRVTRNTLALFVKDHITPVVEAALRDEQNGATLEERYETFKARGGVEFVLSQFNIPAGTEWLDIAAALTTKPKKGLYNKWKNSGREAAESGPARAATSAGVERKKEIEKAGKGREENREDGKEKEGPKRPGRVK